MTVTFSLYLFLVLYGLAAAFVAVFAFFNIYHLLHYGATTRLSYVITMTFIVGVTVIFFLTAQQLRGVDWDQPISLTPGISGASVPDINNHNSP